MFATLSDSLTSGWAFASQMVGWTSAEAPANTNDAPTSSPAQRVGSITVPPLNVTQGPNAVQNTPRREAHMGKMTTRELAAKRAKGHALLDIDENAPPPAEE